MSILFLIVLILIISQLFVVLSLGIIWSYHIFKAINEMGQAKLSREVMERSIELLLESIRKE